jgi:hypothetical protein
MSDLPEFEPGNGGGGHNFSEDILKPKDVLDHLKAHDKRMKNQAPDWALAKAIYTTNYWKHVRGISNQRDSASLQNLIDVEVNRLFPIVGSYLAALYPRAQRSIVTNDPASMTGEAEKAQLANNRWLSSHRIHQRVHAGIRQAIIYPGCGAKVGYSPGRGNPLDRVWMRVIPWWELVLDFDVNDPEDQRFVGHCYYQVKSKIEEEYGLKDLNGTRRDDFLNRSAMTKSSETTKTSAKNLGGADPDDDAFVRVLELINLQDSIQDPNNPDIIYKGRLEIYVLGQSGDISKKPVWMGPLPFAKFDGTPLSHIIPLVFNHEPEFPLRGISHSQRMLPQMQELNSYRAFMAMSTRKDSRQYVTRKGTFTPDTLTKITEGVDGYVAEVEADYARPLGDAISPIVNSALSVNIDRYMGYVEGDLNRTVAQSPQARGEVTKATAFEIQTVQQYTESEFGMHAALKDHWLAEILRVFLRALMAAMQDAGDYAGAFAGKEKELFGVGAMPDTGDAITRDRADRLFDDADVAEAMGKQDPPIGEDMLQPVGVVTTEPPKEVIQQKLTLRGHTGDLIEIEVQDLDAEFEISFVEGGRTPMTDAAMQQNLLGLLQPYSQLWQTVSQGGPMAVFAESYMRVLAERFELPKDLHPDNLVSKAQSAGPAPGVPPQGEPPPEEPAPPEDATAALQQVLSLPPDKALQALAQIFQGNEQMMGVLDQIASAPPDQQALMIEEAVNAIIEGMSQQVSQPEAQPEAPAVDDGAPKGGGPPGAPIPPPGPVQGV